VRSLTAAFAFNDNFSFEQNLSGFSSAISADNAALAAVLSPTLNDLSDLKTDKHQLLTALSRALVANGTGQSAATTQSSSQSQPTTTSTSNAPVKWLLEGIEIEGFRGINNEGSPLNLKFKSDRVNSVSAPNGVGKSSVYDALCYALTGGIPKLDALQATERASDYYLNRFHPASHGTITLTLRPDNGGPINICVVRDSVGKRTVSGPAGLDSDALLAELNREFVLLDAHTFQSFMDAHALQRGRSFAGLLGMSRYSTLRQELQALANTRAFNTHFDTNVHETKRVSLNKQVATHRNEVAADFLSLVKSEIVWSAPHATSQARCHASLDAITVLKPHCSGKDFLSINVDECVTTVKAAEGGEKRQRYISVVAALNAIDHARTGVPLEPDFEALCRLAGGRDEALQETEGAAFHELFRISADILTSEAWPSPSKCPTCGRDDGSSVLETVNQKLAEFTTVAEATTALATHWAAKGFEALSKLEQLCIRDGEAALVKENLPAGKTGVLTKAEAQALTVWVSQLHEMADQNKTSLEAEKAELERELPPSLVAVTEAIEKARNLQKTWKVLERLEKELQAATDHVARIAIIKSFLDRANEKFAAAESTLASQRLAAVQPVCAELFKHIVFSPVVPSLSKRSGTEELSIGLSQFFGLSNVSAQALLPESFRNAFAVSIYLAAASLYGGAPRFMVLDDVTSSFDAGHQHHLIEVIRTRFALPHTANGPQVILLSHDTLLEKLFNKHSASGDWCHQRLEGTARTAVLPQSGAVNKVQDTTIDLLNQGRVDEAAPWIRRYLEYRLHEVIDRCKIPVLMDIAFGDDKRTPGEYLKAIEAAVRLHLQAGNLILDATQQRDMQLHSASIVGNFLSHWETGQVQAFSGPALLGVMQAIDQFPDCFRYEPAPGAQRLFYRSLSQR
jgi:AAA domain